MFNYTIFGYAVKGKIIIDSEVCKGCLYCVEACPNDLISAADRLNAKGYYPAQFDPSGGDPTEGKPTEVDPSEGKPSEGKPSEGKPSEGDPPRDKGCNACTLCAISCPEAAIEVYRDEK
jgi:NAD-dependent dihydropyrimidine dehydrogenase PreA subunit